MRELNKISRDLFEKIRGRFEEVSLGDENARATQNPEDAKFFNFDYVVDDKNLGNITISLIDENTLKIYFSKNISKDLDGKQQQQWYDFLKELRHFAKRNLLTFEPRDITRSTLKIRDIKQVSKDESTFDINDVAYLNEGKMYGTLNRSYESFGPVRIKIAHSKPIVDENNGSRSRNIQSIYVENEQSERFKLPFNNLTGARAMARHISAGGIPTDELGQHITEMVNEMVSLRPFISHVRHRTFEDQLTQDMIESTFGYHRLLKNTLGKLKGKKGYCEFKEKFKPTITENEFDEQDLKEKFVKKIYDNRISSVLPIINKAYNVMKEHNSKEIKQFESWATYLSEGTWALPETPEQIDELKELLSNPLEAGVDGENATSAIYSLIGNDELFDDIEDLAKQDPKADTRELIVSWIETNLPEVAEKLMDQVEEPVTEGFDPEQFDGEFEAQMAGDDGEDEYVTVHYLARVVDGRPVVDKESITARSHNTNPSAKLDDDWATDIAKGKYGDKEYIEMAQEDADEQWAERDVDIPAEPIDESEDDEHLEDISNAIIHRIVNNIADHDELVKKLGPQGIMDAAERVAVFYSPMQEIGSSDVSAMVRHLYQDAGIEYKPGLKENLWYKDLSKKLHEQLEEEYCDACDRTMDQCICEETKLNEGTWHIPETEEDIKGLAELLRNSIPVGVDGINAQKKLGKYIGDDVLYDDIERLAEVDPKAEANSLIVFWLENNMPEVLEKIKELSPDGFVRDQGRDKEERPSDWASAVAADESIEEGKMKGLALDMEELSDDEFEKKYHSKKSDWQEVKNKELRMDPDQPAYISKNLVKEDNYPKYLGSKDDTEYFKSEEEQYCMQCNHLSHIYAEHGENPDIEGEADVVCPNCGSSAYFIATDEEIKKYGPAKDKMPAGIQENAPEMPENPDYSQYDEPTFKRKNPQPQPEKSGWAGYDMDKPAYQRKDQYEKEKEQLRKLAGLK